MNTEAPTHPPTQARHLRGRFLMLAGNLGLRLLEPPCRRVWSTHVFLLQCWETRLGQEMYKLVIFDLLMSLLVILLVQFPRK